LVRLARCDSNQAMSRPRIVCVLLALITLLVYLPAWDGKPIWDDDAHLTKPELRSVHGLVRIWIAPGATQQYYPLVQSVFWVEHRLWGDSTLCYHLANIFLHALGALLLLKILCRLQVPGAYLAAAIFALHPIEVESVAWISELKNTLSGVFYLGAMLVYLKFDRTRAGKFYALALGLFVLGLMSKTVIATLPVALLVIFWWQRGKLSWRQDMWPLIPFFVAGIGAGLFTAWMERNLIGARGVDFNFSFIERVLIAGRAIWFYLGKLFWPVDLVFIYPRWNVNQAIWWQYAFPVAALLLLVILWRVSRRSRGPLAAALFFVGTLFPALGFFNVYPFRYSFVADHFQYLAGIGPITLAAAGIARLSGFLKERKPFLEPALCGALLLVLGVLSWRQSGMYTDIETLWRTTIARNPDAFLAYNNLGNLLRQRGQTDEAITYFNKALEIQPDLPEAHNDLGMILQQEGRVDEAIAQFEKAAEIQPSLAVAYNNLGTALLQKGEVAEAIAQFQNAVKLQPGFADAHYNLGTILQHEGHMDEAIAQFQKTLQIQPGLAAAHNNLGATFLQKGQVAEAIAQFQKAVEIQPGFANAHYNLGMVFLQQGKADEAFAQFQTVLKIQPDSAPALSGLGTVLQQRGQVADAIAHYQKALKIQPDNADACNNLAWILATCPEASVRNGARAVELAKQADQLSGGRNPAIIGTLAAACAEAGRFPEAVTTAQKALQLVESQTNAASVVNDLRTQIGLYQAGLPFRDLSLTNALPAESRP